MKQIKSLGGYDQGYTSLYEMRKDIDRVCNEEMQHHTIVLLYMNLEMAFEMRIIHRARNDFYEKYRLNFQSRPEHHQRSLQRQLPKGS